MVLIVSIIVAFWVLPLLVMLALGLACLVSERLRHSLSRVLGVDLEALAGRRTHIPPARIPVPPGATDRPQDRTQR